MNWVENHLGQVIVSLILAAVCGFVGWLFINQQTGLVEDQVQDRAIFELKDDVDDQYDKWDNLGRMLLDEKNREIDRLKSERDSWRDRYLDCRENE